MDGSMAGESEDFHINEEYAKKYTTWRQKEELQKLKDKYGDVEDDEESSSSSSEDEDAEALTPSVEKGWLRALAAIKSKDPKIYDKNFQFYEDDNSSEQDVKQRKEKIKPMFLHDYERKVILEKEGRLSDDEDEGEEPDLPDGYYEEQDSIKQSIQEATKDDSDDELFTRRNKTIEEKEKEENDYMEWLKGQKDLGPDEKIEKELDPLKRLWSDPKLEDGEKFLRNYILNRNYREDEERAPTYDEIVAEDISEEEEELEKQETFERKYNFRFEEPDPDFIKSYPRTIAESVRRKDSKRAEKRKEDKQRKQTDKEKKMEELRQLKNLKKREILDKLERLKEITGNPNVGFGEDDVDGDFDPQKHDEMMKKVFDEDYEDELEESKPVFADDEDFDAEGGWDQWTGPSTSDPSTSNAGGSQDYGGPHYEDEDFNMDCDYDPTQKYKAPVETKKRKKKSKFAQALERKKPVFDPAEKTFEEYLDEYYKLDYEDIVGDLPCRFKYRQTTANDFGLSTEEILSCRDKELNAWCSLKKTSQYRTEEEDRWDAKLYRKKALNVKKKQNILTSLREPQKPPEETEVKKKRRRRKNLGLMDAERDDSVGLSLKPKDKKDGARSEKVSGPGKKSKDSRTTDQNDKKRKPESMDAGSPKKRKTNEGGDVISGASRGNVKDTETRTEAILEPGDQDNKASGSKSHILPGPSGKGKKKKRSKNKQKVNSKGTANKGFEMSAERLKAYGIDPKKFKYTHAGPKNIHVTGKT